MAKDKKTTDSATDSMAEAKRVDDLASRAPTAEQTKRDDDESQDVTDSPRAIPKHSSKEEHGQHDFTHRGDSEIQGD